MVYDSISKNTIIPAPEAAVSLPEARGNPATGTDRTIRGAACSGMEYDYVVVGAGAAGCAVASRLSEEPSVQVLLLEAGGSDRSLIVDMPAALPFAYSSKRLGWHYQAGPEPHLNGRCIDEKRGRALGGSTTINAMIYNRGNPLDYEGWAELRLQEWAYAHCLPYFRRLESFDGRS